MIATDKENHWVHTLRAHEPHVLDRIKDSEQMLKNSMVEFSKYYWKVLRCIASEMVHAQTCLSCSRKK